MSRVPEAFILTLDSLNDGGYRAFYPLRGFAFLTTQNHLISERANTFERYQKIKSGGAMSTSPSTGSRDYYPERQDRDILIMIFNPVIRSAYLDCVSVLPFESRNRER